MTEIPTARLLAMALRSPRRGPMLLVEQALAQADGGLAGDGHVSPERGVTLLSREQWETTTRELGVELPWHTRRANLLVEGIELGETIGRTLQIGDVLLRIEGETDPCAVMDRAHHGLRARLKPDCRGGVHGRVLRGGRVAIGDIVTICE